MLTWQDIVHFARNGNPNPNNRIERTQDEWRSLLSDKQFRITRQRGTEPPFSSEICHLHKPNLYACICCDNLLFDATEKFDSGTGWPSFTQAIEYNAIAYHEDNSHGMSRIEVTCNTCDAHLGHVFPDGPTPNGLRYCINAVALKKVSDQYEKATFGGGCFWCTEAIFSKLKGVKSVRCGYSGGNIENPDYHSICTGSTGHAEVVQIIFDPAVISYYELLQIHLSTHNPTTLNRQGADTGTQYRSIILAHNDTQYKTAEIVIKKLQASYTEPIVTQVAHFDRFYLAELEHQKYYDLNPHHHYCQAVIDPKLKKFKTLYADKLI